MKSNHSTQRNFSEDFPKSAFESQISSDCNPNNISGLNRSYFTPQNESSYFQPSESVQQQQKRYLPGYEIEADETPGNFDGLNISQYENKHFNDSGITPQKAKFFFCALQKFARKSLWDTVIKRIQCYNSMNAKYIDSRMRQQTSTYDHTSASYYTKTYGEEEVELGGHHDVLHYTNENHDLSMDYTNLISDFGGRRDTVSSKNNYASNPRQDGKSISYSYILSEVQNDASMIQEPRNESYFRISTVETDPNKRVVTNSESEQHYGEEYIYEGLTQLTQEDEFIVTMGRHDNALQRAKSKKFMERPRMFLPDDNMILSTEVTKAGDQEQIKKLREKNSKLFCLLMKKNLESFVKRSLEVAFESIKEHSEDVKEELERREYRKLELLEVLSVMNIKNIKSEALQHWRKVSKEKNKELFTHEGFDSLEYSYRTISPSNRPTHQTQHARQKSFISEIPQNSFEVSLNERKIRLQFMCTILKKEANITLGEAFRNIEAYSQERYKKILSKRFAEILENFTENKLHQNFYLSFKALHANMRHKRDLEEKEKIYKITQHYQALALNQPLQKICLRLKSEVFNNLKGIMVVEKETDKYKKDLMMVKSLNKKTAQFVNILQNCQKINQKYENYCNNSAQKSNKSIDDYYTSPCKENNKENFATMSSSYKTPLFDRTPDVPKIIQVSHPKYKFMIEALETVYINRLKSAFTQIKRSNIVSERTVTRRTERITPRTYKAESSALTTNTVKVQSLLENLRRESRETKFENTRPNTNSNSSFEIENSSFDLQSAISFFKSIIIM